MSSSDTPRKNIRPIYRYITTHDTNGKSVFTTVLPEELPMKQLPGDAQFGLGYATNHFPPNLNEDSDIKTYNSFLSDLPGVTVPNGTVLRVVDMLPGATSPMHRTVSLDYGVVLEGEVELILDEGETRVLKRGDIAVQRGTIHAWRNTSPDHWARMLYVLQDAAPMTAGGKQLEEDYGGIPDVKPSRH